MTRKEAIQVLNKVEAHGSLVIQAKEMAIKALEQEPQTGHWIVAKGGSYLGMRNGCCSNCKDFYTNDWNVMNYCPNCGAKMEDEE